MKLTILLAAALIATPGLAGNQCRGDKGRFVKCPTTASAPSASSDIAKGKDGKCRWTKTTKDHKAGTFVKCP